MADVVLVENEQKILFTLNIQTISELATTICAMIAFANTTPNQKEKQLNNKNNGEALRLRRVFAF